jgi:hypothetical protein
MMHPNGNVFCAGAYGVNCTVVAGADTLNGNGNDNSYLALLSQDGNLLQVTNLTATGNYLTPANSVYFSGRPVVDDSGYLYCTLNIAGPVMVDSININGNMFGASLLSKWNSADRCLWVKQFANLTNPAFYNGNLYALGSYYYDSVTIDSFTLYNNYTNKNTAYLTKLDEQGNCKWVKQATGGNTQFLNIKAGNNRVYICAQTDSCFNYDTVHLCGQNGNTGVLLQTDTNGNVQWRSVIYSAGAAYMVAVSADSAGNCLVLGRFDTTIYIGGDTLNKGSNDPKDFFIAKYDSAGNILWISQMYFSGEAVINSFYTDKMGYSYLTGAFGGTATFGGRNIVPDNGSGLFVARFSPNGSFIGLVIAFGADAFDITGDSAGNAYVTGAIGASATFGSINLAGNVNNDFFIAKLSPITDSTDNINSLAPCNNTLQIFANPNAGIFTLTVPQCIMHATTGNLTVYDYQGNVIKNETVNLSASKIEVDLGVVTRGVYNVLLTANGMQFSGRVVVQ